MRLMSTDHEPPSSFETLLLERRDNIVQVTLNRPKRLNALSIQLQTELTGALRSIASDPEVRAVILTGQGRAFCAGLDLKEFPDSLTHFGQTAREETVFQVLDALPQPVIGAINGLAVTGGFEMALCCDLLIASHHARFADTHAILGVMPGAGLSQKLPRIIGRPRAMSLSLTGEFLEADTACQWGLVSHLTSPEELLPLAWRLAERIAANDPVMVPEMKRVIRQGALMSEGEALAFERKAHLDWAGKSDMDSVMGRREGLLARTRSASGDN